PLPQQDRCRTASIRKKRTGAGPTIGLDVTFIIVKRYGINKINIYYICYRRCLCGMINMELYRTFYWVAKEGNLSRAAERLFVTQPSVSHAIRQLEEQLGVNLLHRGPRGVTLTEEGQLLFDHVEQAFQALESAERMIGEQSRLLRGELRIGGSDSLIKHYLLPALSRFCSDYPGIHLVLAN